jgi:hypothetical protein
LLSGSQWRYCAKVGIATALGYLLTQGGQNEYAIYSAFTAALVGPNFLTIGITICIITLAAHSANACTTTSTARPTR